MNEEHRRASLEFGVIAVLALLVGCARSEPARKEIASAPSVAQSARMPDAPYPSSSSSTPPNAPFIKLSTTATMDAFERAVLPSRPKGAHCFLVVGPLKDIYESERQLRIDTPRGPVDAVVTCRSASKVDPTTTRYSINNMFEELVWQAAEDPSTAARRKGRVVQAASIFWNDDKDAKESLLLIGGTVPMAMADFRTTAEKGWPLVLFEDPSPRPSKLRANPFLSALHDFAEFSALVLCPLGELVPK